MDVGLPRSSVAAAILLLLRLLVVRPASSTVSVSFAAAASPSFSVDAFGRARDRIVVRGRRSSFRSSAAFLPFGSGAVLPAPTLSCSLSTMNPPSTETRNDAPPNDDLPPNVASFGRRRSGRLKRSLAVVFGSEIPPASPTFSSTSSKRSSEPAAGARRSLRFSKGPDGGEPDDATDDATAAAESGRRRRRPRSETKKQLKAKKKAPKKKKASLPTEASIRLRSSDLDRLSPGNPWIDLNVPPGELRPSATLTNGQCFSWTPVVVDGEENAPATPPPSTPPVASPSAWGVHDAEEWVGPLGPYVLSIRETPTTTLYRVLNSGGEPAEKADSHLRSYFNLDVPLRPLYESWSDADERRLAKIARALPGVRVLRQDPTECLFSFLCSSNNNIPRITKMLSSLRKAYGRKMMDLPGRKTGDDGNTVPVEVHSFPTLDDLESATESDLRSMGFGYRAKYVIETRDLLLSKGGKTYLSDLRSSSIDRTDVRDQLMEFAGVGRKVADCVALFSLDRADAIPVDVHVWNIACRDYDPTLKDGPTKSLTPATYERVGDLFRGRFGENAGWAHSLLFAAELPSFRPVLPEDVLAEMDEWKEKEAKQKAAEREAKSKKKKSP